MKNSVLRFVKMHPFIFLPVTYFIWNTLFLTKLPIFNDEAIYLDWGWKSLHTDAGLFYSLYDAKSPLLIWLFGIAETVIPSPLFVGRLVAIFAGFFTLLGIFNITKTLHNRKIAFFAALLHIVTPLFLFFNRQALMESSVAAIGVWSFYFLQKLVETKKVKFAAFLGLVLGVGIWIKLSTTIFLVTSLAILLWKRQGKSLFLTLACSQLILMPLYFQPSFWHSLSSNHRYIWSVSEIFRFPFLDWAKNMASISDISFFHLTPPVFVLSILGLFLYIKHKKTLLPMFFLTNIVLVVFLAKSLNPRYLLPYLPLAVVASSYAITQMKKFALLIVGITISVPAVVSALLVFSPQTYFDLLEKFTTYSQKSEYVTNWTSGYGIPETIHYLDEKTQGGKLIVGVRLDTGNPESAMFTYFNASPNVTVTYLDSRILGDQTQQLECLKSVMPIYFIARDGNLAGLDTFFQEEKRFYKPESERYISIHSLKMCN